MNAPSLASRIETERLTLRPARAGDAAAIAALLRSNRAHLRPWSPRGALALTDRAALLQILEQRARWRADRAYALWLVREGAIVGRVTFGAIVRGVFQNAYLGYFIDARAQGDGLMTEALRGAIGWAFGSLGLHRVQAAIMPRNAASLRVAEKIGMRREGYAARYLEIAGRWEDHVLCAVTREEWPAARVTRRASASRRSRSSRPSAPSRRGS